MRFEQIFVSLLFFLLFTGGPVLTAPQSAKAEPSRYAAAKKKKKKKKNKKKKKKNHPQNPLANPVTLTFRGAGAIQLDDEYSDESSTDCRVDTNLFSEIDSDVQWEAIWNNVKLADNANLEADEAEFSASMDRSQGVRVNLSECTPGQTFNECVAPDPDCLLVSSACTNASLSYLEGFSADLLVEQQGNNLLITVEAEQLLETTPGQGSLCYGSTLFDNAIAEHITQTQFLLVPKNKDEVSGVQLNLQPTFDCTDPARQTEINTCTITNNLTATLEVSGKWDAVPQ